MNPTPTGGPATPSLEGDEPVEGVVTEGAAEGPTEDVAEVVVPAPRSGAHPLPRRVRPVGGPREAGPDTRPGPDAATLDRLLSGLRDI